MTEKQLKSKRSPVDRIEKPDIEVDSVALQRLIAEVRRSKNSLNAYNRTYHRHNR